MFENIVEIPRGRVTYLGYRRAIVLDKLITIGRNTDVGMVIENELTRRSGGMRDNHVVFALEIENPCTSYLYYWMTDDRIVIGTKIKFN